MIANEKKDKNKIIAEIVSHGYKEFKPGPWDKGAEKAFQKRFIDGKGNTKYFITIYMYTPLTDHRTGQTWGAPFELSLQVYGTRNHEAIDMLFHSTWELDDVEAFMEKLFATGMLDFAEKDAD